jgi:hypothetical protein
MMALKRASVIVAQLQENDMTTTLSAVTTQGAININPGARLF